MKYSEFMAKIRKGELPHVFLLSGEEHYYIDKAKEALLGRLFPDGRGREDALQKVDGDLGLDALLAGIESAPFFADKNVILLNGTNLFRDSKQAGGDTKELDSLIRLLGDMPPYSYIIFIAPYKADKRRKLYKTVAKYGLVLESEALRAWNINDWLQDKLRSLHKDMDREAYAYFAGAVSMMQQVSLSYLDQEFDKLALFSKDRRITKAELVEVFSGLPEVSIFALLDAISARDSKKALMLLHRQLADGMYFTVLVALLTRHVRQLWQAKVLMKKGIRGKALAKPLELNPFIAEKLGRAAAGFDEAVLKRAMLMLIDADYLLKTGQAGNEVLEETVILLCRK
ncbi:DNA polymerase III subunit delta [uncultured Mitsuokella sp.]|uniref:DNA polymerase III subunit delta n=1 Tax=uncultured Mitsuokella sp. TaxID=453120 RepID=UPI0025E5EBAB|nr:DNA polymerase III subunit delta [uncultured Mitsuokella sp.]